MKKNDLLGRWRKDTRRGAIVLLHPTINRRAALLDHTISDSGNWQMFREEYKSKANMRQSSYSQHQVISSSRIFRAETLFGPLYLIVPATDRRMFFHIPRCSVNLLQLLYCSLFRYLTDKHLHHYRKSGKTSGGVLEIEKMVNSVIEHHLSTCQKAREKDIRSWRKNVFAGTVMCKELYSTSGELLSAFRYMLRNTWAWQNNKKKKIVPYL